VVVALHKPIEPGRDVEVLRHLVQHDSLFEAGVAHRSEELELLPDRIGHGGGSLAGRWGEWACMVSHPFRKKRGKDGARGTRAICRTPLAQRLRPARRRPFLRGEWDGFVLRMLAEKQVPRLR
jgi:hypothetical protein